MRFVVWLLQQPGVPPQVKRTGNHCLASRRLGEGCSRAMCSQGLHLLRRLGACRRGWPRQLLLPGDQALLPFG